MDFIHREEIDITHVCYAFCPYCGSYEQLESEKISKHKCEMCEDEFKIVNNGEEEECQD